MSRISCFAVAMALTACGAPDSEKIRTPQEIVASALPDRRMADVVPALRQLPGPCERAPAAPVEAGTCEQAALALGAIQVSLLFTGMQVTDRRNPMSDEDKLTRLHGFFCSSRDVLRATDFRSCPRAAREAAAAFAEAVDSVDRDHAELLELDATEANRQRAITFVEGVQDRYEQVLLSGKSLTSETMSLVQALAAIGATPMTLNPRELRDLAADLRKESVATAYRACAALIADSVSYYAFADYDTDITLASASGRDAIGLHLLLTILVDDPDVTCPRDVHAELAAIRTLWPTPNDASSEVFERESFERIVRFFRYAAFSERYGLFAEEPL